MLKKMYIVEKFEKRKRTKGGYFGVGMIIEEGGKMVISCYINDVESPSMSKLMTLETGVKVIITDVIGGNDCLRLTAKSKVMTKVANFNVDMGVVNNFIRPEVVSLSEAKGSPQKKRISVQGCVVEMGEYVCTDSYKRRSIWLGNGDTKMEVVLWGEAAASTFDLVANEVIITAVVVQGIQLRSTPSTVVEANGMDSVEGVIIAVGDTSDGYPVDIYLETEECLRLPESTHFDINLITLPCGVEFSADSSGLISEIKMLDFEE